MQDKVRTKPMCIETKTRPMRFSRMGFNKTAPGATLCPFHVPVATAARIPDRTTCFLFKAGIGI